MMNQQELIYMLRQWGQADPTRLQEPLENIFVAICSDRSAVSWDANVHSEMDSHTQHFFERAVRESIRDRALQVNLSENYTEEGYKFRVSLGDFEKQWRINSHSCKLPRCECSAGFKNSSFEAYLSSFAVFLISTQPAPA